MNKKRPAILIVIWAAVLLWLVGMAVMTRIAIKPFFGYWGVVVVVVLMALGFIGTIQASLVMSKKLKNKEQQIDRTTVVRLSTLGWLIGIAILAAGALIYFLFFRH